MGIQQLLANTGTLLSILIFDESSITKTIYKVYLIENCLFVNATYIDLVIICRRTVAVESIGFYVKPLRFAACNMERIHYVHIGQPFNIYEGNSNWKFCLRTW